MLFLSKNAFSSNYIRLACQLPKAYFYIKIQSPKAGNETPTFLDLKSGKFKTLGFIVSRKTCHLYFHCTILPWPQTLRNPSSST